MNTAVMIWAVIKAVPQLIKLFENIFDLYMNDQINGSRAKLQKMEKTRAILIKKMKEAKDDDERIALSIAINNLN